MIEDTLAQNHLLVDSLTFADGQIAQSALRTLSRSRQQGGPFAQLLGIEILSLEDGHCRAALEVQQHHLNPLGIAHGGVAFSLADHACGAAAYARARGQRLVTQDMQIRYHGPGRNGRIEAEGRVIHHGRRTITTEGRIWQNELLIASVTATFAILSEPEVIDLTSPGSNDTED